MIRYIGLFLVLLYSTVLSGQQSSWTDLMMKKDVNYDEVLKAYNSHFEGKEKVKHSGHVQFERWSYHVAPRVRKDGSIRPVSDILQASKSYYSNHASRSANGDWIEIGPWEEENYSRGVGRLSHIAFHPTNKDILFIASPAGGIWKSTDYGKTWFNVDSDLPNFGVSYIHINQSNPNLMYAATGDINANESEGNGVYKSTDGGTTWLPSNQGIEEETVGKVLEIKGQTNHLLCITKTGIYKSTDAGATWTLKSISRDFRDLEMKPNDPNTWYASTWTANNRSSYMYVSKDKGETWEIRNYFNGLFPDTRWEIEVTEAEPNKVYLLGGNRMYYSDNSGDSLKLMHDGGAFLVNYDSQGWYNASFEISNTDPNIMFSGNVRKYMSYDKGQTWVRLNHTHADNHYITYAPDNKTLYVLDDGGVHRSYDNGRSFEDLTSMGIGAIYSVAQSPFNANHTLTGYQDCGSKYYDGQKWTSVYGADGMQALYDHFDSTRFYTGYQYGGIVRHLKHLGSAQSIPKPDNDYRRSWVTPYILDAYNPETMYCGGEFIWKTTNLFENKTKNIKWEKISTGIANNTNGDFMRIKLHRTNYARMYVLRRDASRAKTRLIKCDNIYDSVIVWDDLSLNYASTRMSADFETDPFDSLSIYLLADNDILVSRDGGATFSNFSGSLPDVPMHTVRLDTVTRDLYLGTHAGVFYRGASDTDWTPFSNGLSRNARVRDMDIYYHPTDHNLSRLKAATYGRGLWESALVGGNGIPEPVKAYITADYKPFSFEDTYTLKVSFKNHIHLKKVSGLDTSDFSITNGEAVSLVSNGDEYTLEVKATSHGWVTVKVKASAVTDQTYNLPSIESSDWTINYKEPNKQFGYLGPGGVGDTTTMVFWMKADHLMMNKDGDTITTDGERIARWNNFMGKDYFATQSIDSSMPFLRTDTSGINGWPAVEFLPANQFLRINEITPVGENLSVFAVAKSNKENWVGHSWIANSREENGFLIHNNNDSKSVYGVTVDNSKRYVGTGSMDAVDPTQQHIFGLQTDFSKWRNNFQIDNQTTYDYINRTYTRNGNDTISLRLGKDFRERYGDGKLSEMIYFKEDVLEAKRLIVANYLASKYAVDLKQDKRYDFAFTHPLEVAGIGRVSEQDFHNDAKGTGELRIIAGSGLGNNEFLMWGHNGDSLDVWKEITGVQEEKLEILQRSWRLTERGDVGVVEIRIDKDKLPQTDDNLGLIMAQNADFSDASIYALNDMGDYYSVNVNVKDAAYLSFAKAAEFTVGSAILDNISGMQLYPNPAENGFSTLSFIFSKNASATLQVIDQLGSIQRSREVQLVPGENKLTIDVSTMATGVYFVHLSGAGVNKVIRLVK